MEPIIEKKLANGIKITVTNHSRQIAVDRWYIKIICRCSMVITDDLYISIGSDSMELIDCIRHQLGDQAELEMVRERNFVDEAEKEQVIAEILDKINENISGYLSAEQFAQKLIIKCYNEAKADCQLEKSAVHEDHDEDEDGPADFSECFRE